jgi:diguanylate cyclase (GGDEF)-like protein
VNLFRSLNLWKRFTVLIALFSISFAVSGFWSFKTLNEFRVTGDAYQEIVRGKDTAAYIQERSHRIVESYLLCLRLSGATNKAEQDALLNRLRALLDTDSAQRRTTQGETSQSSPIDPIMDQADALMSGFRQAAAGDFIPALRDGDRQRTADALHRLTQLHDASGATFRTLAQVADSHSNGNESIIKDRIRWATLLLFAILVLSLGIGLKIAQMIRDSITAPLSEVAEVAKRIATGDFDARVDDSGRHEFAELGTAMNKMAVALEKSRAMLASNAAELEHHAMHDRLTGLPNRTLLEDRLRQSMLHARRYQRQLMVLFIDLDNFKDVNDSMGHHMGDELLKCVAERMVACVRTSDTVVRLGGDEFVILLLDQTEKPEASIKILQKIRDAVAMPMQIGAHQLRVTCSIGLASYPRDGADVGALLRNADAAMYAAKEMGRNNFQFYTAEINAKVHERLRLAEQLRNALTHSEFFLEYQPQVDAQSERILGVEALVRWRHPELGMVPPGRFIPLAEDTGLIVEIGDWVLKAACLQNKAWQDAGLPPLVMSVNVSARQFRDAEWIRKVERALSDSGLKPEYLELEVTESLIMHDVSQAIVTMGKLQAMGVRLAIDDFGTGYSSLSALKSFPVARLKIDRSFVCNIPVDKNDEAIASAVIALGHRLNLRVIAEGVETQEQLLFLRKNLCDEVQGFYFSRPLSAEGVELFIVDGQRADKESARQASQMAAGTAAPVAR